MHTKSPVLLIGSGRLAKHLQFWNSLLAEPNEILSWTRAQDVNELKSLLLKKPIVWLAINDNAIETFYNLHLVETETACLHFSGTLSLAKISCAHPLMSFPTELMPAHVYSQIHFAVSKENVLHDFLPGFTNSFTVLTPENKSFYHALCVMAGNFPQLLWNEVETQMKALHIPATATDLYIRQIADNYLQLKQNSITGPLVRKDHSTIEKNLSALSANSHLKNIYAVFTREFGS